jgi:cytochrome c-type biogenesis protein CcmH/NrfG
MAGHTDRLSWCVILLTAFFFVRTLGERTRPVAAPLDCEHAAAADVTAMERCLAVRPGDVELMAELARAYERAARWDRAESVYRRAIAVDVDDSDIRVRLGHVLLRRGDSGGARREAEIAVALQPGRKEPLELLRLANGGEAELER